jgi:hypothetical protein
MAAKVSLFAEKISAYRQTKTPSANWQKGFFE